MNNDNAIDIIDIMAINASILGLKDNCGELTAAYSVADGKLYIDSEVALAGFQFNLSDEPAVLDMPGFSARGNWVNGDYILLVYSLDGEKEPGLYAVLDLGNANLNGIVLSTKEGCSVTGMEDVLSISEFDESLITVYPVPAHDELTIEGQHIRTVEVFDLLGQRLVSVENVSSDLSKINVSALVPGSYFVRINGNVTKKIMVK